MESSILTYLHHRYRGEFVIRSITYEGFETGGYDITASPVGKENVTIDISAFKNSGSPGINTHLTTDNYDDTLWAEELNDSLAKSFEHIYGSDTGRLLLVEGTDSSGEPHIPFHEAVNKFPKSIALCVYLIIPLDKGTKPNNSEALRLFRLVQLLKQKAVTESNICIYFIPQDTLRSHVPPSGTNSGQFSKYMVTYGNPFYEVVIPGKYTQYLNNLNNCQSYIDNNYEKGNEINFLHPHFLF